MELQNDKALDIATGASRTSLKWKNSPIQWSELLDRLSAPTRTQETVAEYHAMSKKEQALIKDVGGFVGGYCNEGRRLRLTIRHRSIITLDGDYAEPDLWEKFKSLYPYASAAYSTHKHTPENPRVRYLIPLSRNVSPDEYQAIARKIANNLGMNQFDPTCFEPQQLMYWPSCARNGEYLFKYQDQPFLDPDTILALYYDWTDMSAWPMACQEKERIRKTTEKQQDPIEKTGIVGMFCRAFYPIQEAIARFVPAYEECSGGRYTYTEGSTAGGVVVYQDKYTFSHHATDPASGQLCNAWDLVRLHRFGHLDADTAPGTPAGGRPSYKEMVAFVGELPEVKAQMVKEHRQDYDDVFGEDFPEEDEDYSWTSRLKVNGKGALCQTIENAVTMLSYDPKLADCIALNELEHTVVAVKDLPWRKLPKDCGGISLWSDADDAALRLYMEKQGLQGKEKIYDAVNIVAQKHAFHPIRDYLASCTWDGTPRLDTLLVDYLGATDCPYTRTVTRKALVAAVARVYTPGCKFDYMLTIQGKQGIGKSALFAALGGNWFSDSINVIHGKEAYEQVQGVWIVEMGELATLRKNEVEQVKQYLSKRTDRYRPAYGRRSQDFPRQCIFIGTTNETNFLRDNTGNRRFWIVDTPNTPCHRWSDLTPEEIRQIWAEAVVLYRAGEKLYLDAEMEAIAETIQSAYEEEDARVGMITDYLDRLLPENWDEMDIFDRREWLDSDKKGTVQRRYVCTMELYSEALGRNPDKVDNYELKMIGQIMARIKGWEYQRNKVRRFRHYKRQRYYRRITPEEDLL